MTTDGDAVRPWYAEGLRFECTQCGNCCSGGPGAVWFTSEEAGGMARALGLLALVQLALARDRQLGQGFTRSDVARIHPSQNLSKRLAVRLRMGHLRRQGGQQIGLALGRAALF